MNPVSWVPFTYAAYISFTVCRTEIGSKGQGLARAPQTFFRPATAMWSVLQLDIM